MKDREAWLAAVHGMAKLLSNNWDMQIPFLKGGRGVCNFCVWIFSSCNNSKNKRLECFLGNRKFRAE